jgi:hypothetical protein
MELLLGIAEVPGQRALERERMSYYGRRMCCLRKWFIYGNSRGETS